MTPTPNFQRTFALDTTALLAGSATSVSLSAATAEDVLAAIAANTAFPARSLDVANFGFATKADEKHLFGQANHGQVRFQFGAGARSRLGVFTGAEVLPALALDDAKELSLEFSGAADERFTLFVADGEAQAGAQGAHPLGALGSVKFGGEVRAAALLAVVQRFAGHTGARDVLAQTFSNWKLPRHVTRAGQLAPGATLLAETEGSVSLKVTTMLGYDFSFVREVEGLGLQGDLGLKLDLGLKAALGFDAAGRYLVALERPGDDARLRLRLFKLRRRGWNFGLNLAAKVTTEAGAVPGELDDLVKAVFGVHGQQVVRELRRLDKWTSPEEEIGHLIAGFTKEHGAALLKKVFGGAGGGANGGAAKFKQLRDQLTNALKQWETLPDRVSGWLWKGLETGQLAGPRRTALESTLRLLASPSNQTRQQELTRLLGLTGIDNDHGLQFLVSFADFGAERGLAALLDDSQTLQTTAARVLDVLNGGVIERLQQFIQERLNLAQFLQGSGDGAPDAWLTQKLTAVLGAERMQRLDDARADIHAVLRRRDEIFTKARQALERQYDFDLAYRYQSSTTKTALIDATFDTSHEEARSLLAAILEDARYDQLLAQATPGVTLREGVLTHQIDRRSSVQVQMPFYRSQDDTITTSLAKVTAQEDGGRVLFYELDAENRVVKNRLRSQLALAGSVPLAQTTGVRVHGTAGMQWSYRFHQVILNARRPELERRATPIIEEYFPRHFAAGGPGSFSTYLSELDRTIQHRDADSFGDLLVSLDVALPAAVMAAWFQPRTAEQVKAAGRAVSVRLQKALQRLIPFFYFQNVKNLQRNAPCKSLLVFASIPAKNNFALEGNKLIDRPGAIWDVRRADLRQAIINNATTTGQLAALLTDANIRLRNANETAAAKFFDPRDAREFLRDTADDVRFLALLQLASVATEGVEKALKDLREFTQAAAQKPSAAIERLAAFGAEITETFNSGLANTYGTQALRPLGSMVFLEATRALDASLAKVRPRAVLSVTVLKDQREFAADDFLRNRRPAAGDVAWEQRLVSA